ncbi:MAG: ABC transporter permease subunit [Thermoplasmata archaeon]
MRKFLTIVKRETWREIKSLKIIVIAVIMLAIILGTIPLISSSFQSSSPQFGLLVAPFNNNGSMAVKLLVIDNTGNPVSISGNLSYIYYNNGTRVFISNFKTSSYSTITIYSDIPFSNYVNQPKIFFEASVSGINISTYYIYKNVSDSLSISYWDIVSPSNSSLPGIAILVTSFDGKVPSNFSIYINNTLAGIPNNFGYVKAYGTGNVTYKYMNTSGFITFLSPIQGISITVQEVITSLSSSLISLFVPIAAIIAGYDAFAKEKVSGALDIILSRPLKRETVYWGKILGAFIPIFIYFTIISLLSLLFLMQYGIFFTPLEILSLVASVSFLTFVFIILEGISGFFGRSVATPIIWGIVIWIFFNMIYSIFSLVVIFISGTNILSTGAVKIENIIGLGNPIDIARYITYFSIPNSQILIYGVSFADTVIASLAWIIVTVLIFIYLSKKFE